MNEKKYLIVPAEDDVDEDDGLTQKQLLVELASTLGYDLIRQRERNGKSEHLNPREIGESDKAANYTKIWDDFWKEICTNPDGSLNLDQIQRELSDLYLMMAWIPVVYDHVSGGMVSKALTWPSVVCSLADDHTNDVCDDAIKEAIENHKAEHWTRDDESTYNSLLLVGFNVPIGEIPGWTDEQVKQAEQWASSIHFKASDNDVDVMQKPEFLLESWREESVSITNTDVGNVKDILGGL